MKRLLEEKDKQLSSEVMTSASLEAILEEKEQELLSVVETCSSLRLLQEEMKKFLEEKDKQFLSEIRTSACLRAQVKKTNELLLEKNVEIQRLRELLSKGDLLRQSIPVVPTSQEEKVFKLFKDVLLILIQDNKSNQQKKRIDWLSSMELLKGCRLVCKSWKQSVDHILQEDPSHLAFAFEGLTESESLSSFRLYNTPCPLVFSIEYYDSSIAVQSVFQILRDHDMTPSPDYNPLPSRHLMIQIDDYKTHSRKWNHYSQLLTEYLQVFGRHVWYLTLSIDEGPLQNAADDFIVIFNSLPVWFQLISNLRSLSIDMPSGHPPLSAQNEDSLHRAIDQLSFPRLGHLITFQCSSCGHSKLFHSILKSNTQIQRLSFLDGEQIVMFRG